MDDFNLFHINVSTPGLDHVKQETNELFLFFPTTQSYLAISSRYCYW